MGGSVSAPDPVIVALEQVAAELEAEAARWRQIAQQHAEAEGRVAEEAAFDERVHAMVAGACADAVLACAASVRARIDRML